MDEPNATPTPEIPTPARIQSRAIERLRQLMIQGILAPLKSKRHNPHQRQFTKSYADHRQRKATAVDRAARPSPRRFRRSIARANRGR